MAQCSLATSSTVNRPSPSFLSLFFFARMDSQASTAQRPSFSLTWSLPVPKDSSPHTEHFPACACDTQDNSKLSSLRVKHQLQNDSQLIWRFWRAVSKCFGQNNQQRIPDHWHDCLSKGSRSVGPGSEKKAACVYQHIQDLKPAAGFMLCAVAANSHVQKILVVTRCPRLCCYATCYVCMSATCYVCMRRQTWL